MALTKHFLNTPAVYRIGTRCICYIPKSIAYAVSQSIADLSYFFYKGAVGNVKKNLALVFPDFSEKQLSVVSRELFRNYSKYLVDYGRFTYLGKKEILNKIVHFEGSENLDSALSMKKGLILLTAHLGNWEFGGIFFGNYGLRVNVVTLPDENSEINNVRNWYRKKHNVRTITIGDSPFSSVDLVRALNSNEIIAMLIDRYHRTQDSVTIEFFHRPTTFSRGPFILGRLTGAPIVMAFVVMEGNGYKGIVEEPFFVNKENEEKEMRKVVKALEKYVTMYPNQWYNFIPI